MGELLQINIGKTGNDIGFQYLANLIKDHKLLEQGEIDQQQRNEVKISFSEKKENQFFIRGIFDHCEKLQAKIQDQPEGKFIDPNFFLPRKISNQIGTFHNGKNIFQNEQKDQFLEQLRRNIEDCDRMIGLNLAHSTYDNSAGAAAEAMRCIKEEFPQDILTSFSVFPNVQSTNAIDIYNVIFSIHNLVEYCEVTMVFDYKALEKAIQRQFNIDSFTNYNNIISETMLQLTCSQRFNGYLNGSIRKLATNMIPFPRIHFLSSSFIKLNTYENLEDQISNLTLPKNSYFTFKENQDYDENQYLTQSLLTRSKNQNLLFQEATKNFSNKVEWIGDPFYHINCSREHSDLGTTLMHVGNQKYFGQNFLIYADYFTAHFRRKSFIHHYTQQGVDEMEFTEAESNLNDLVSEYQGGCCAYYDYEGDDDDYY